MCGIAGIYDSTGVLEESSLRLMTDALSHRGPDAAGFLVETPWMLGHRRLSVLDLSSNANQPLYSACGRYVIVFNGEVYNFRELAAQLGIRCRTKSDTEVVLEAFALLGPRFVEHLNGMFSLAILDRQEHRLFLLRDRIGIKPLFYYRDSGKFLFASELKAILSLRQHLATSLCSTALVSYLSQGFIPAPETAYTNIFKLPPGCYAEFDGKRLRIQRYWQIEQQMQRVALSDEVAAEEEWRRLIFSSVKYRMISDVPFGAFLSGGIDSSLVTAVAQSQCAAPLNTFSIGFSDARFNELPFARKVAEHLGTNHHELILTEKDALELLPEITTVFDEPFADSSAAPTMLVSRMARKLVTITLSGDGGDELFLGYGAYAWAERLNNPAVWAFRKLLSRLCSLGSDRYRRIAEMLDAPNKSSLPHHILAQEHYYFLFQEMDSLLTPSLREHFHPPQFRALGPRRVTAAEQQALFDLEYYLPDDLLTKVDRASMRYGLEARVPLLDHRIIELAVNLSPALKRRNGTTKYLLKKLLFELVPASLFNRPKRGFSLPLGRWMTKELLPLEKTYLNSRLIRESGIVNEHYVQQLKDRFHRGEKRLYVRLWALIVLHKWLQESRLRAS